MLLLQPATASPPTWRLAARHSPLNVDLAPPPPTDGWQDEPGGVCLQKTRGAVNDDRYSVRCVEWLERLVGALRTPSLAAEQRMTPAISGPCCMLHMRARSWLCVLRARAKSWLCVLRARARSRLCELRVRARLWL